MPADLAALQLIPTAIAPDGYRLRENYRGSGGLFGELFGMRTRHRMIAIEKDGRVVEISTAIVGVQRYNYYNVQFLGWMAVE